MDNRGLDFVTDPEARTLVRQMLAAVVDHPELHPNRFRYQRTSEGDWSYFVAGKGGGSVFPQYSRLKFNVVDMLLARGWAEGDREPGHGEGWYRFTDQAIDWYRANSGLTNEQVRSLIGRHFLVLDEREGPEPHHFDADVIAQEIGIEEARVIAQTQFLVGAGMLADVGPKGAKMPKFYQLNVDGYRWAEGEFQSIASLGSTTVNVQVGVHLSISQFLLDLGSLNVPTELKQEAAATVEELQREPTLEKVGKLMELGANTVTLVPALIRFFTENGPALQQVVQRFPLGS